MKAASIIVPSQLVYMNIPAKELRGFADALFPSLAVSSIADSARGFGHRYVAGHDLFLDVPKTLVSHGPSEGLRHAGHILLTDFPTKAGIPLPFLSKSGLGSILEQAGIHRGWLQVSLFDSGVGIFAIAEGSVDLAQAIHGTLVMNWGTFFDTFIEGGIEIGLSLSTQNPILFLAGIENILTGIVATWNNLTTYIDPLDFFGSAGVSALTGFALSYGLAGEDLSDAGLDAVRSGAVGAFFTLSPAFGFGALAGFAAFRLGQDLAKAHNESMDRCFSIDRQSYNALVEEICKGNPNINVFLEKALPLPWLQEKIVTLKTESIPLTEHYNIIPDTFVPLGTKSNTLQAEPPYLNVETKVLPDDPMVISTLYKK